jgi:hypothetical protein
MGRTWASVKLLVLTMGPIVVLAPALNMYFSKSVIENKKSSIKVVAEVPHLEC